MGCLRDVVDRALDASSRTPPRKVSRASRTPTVGSTPKDAAVEEGNGKEQPSGGSEKSTTSSVVSEELIALGARKRKAPGRSVGSGDLFEKAQVSMLVKVVLLVKGEIHKFPRRLQESVPIRTRCERLSFVRRARAVLWQVC